KRGVMSRRPRRSTHASSAGKMPEARRGLWIGVVAQSFQTAGSAGFPARHSIGRLESRPNPQVGKPALHLGSWIASTILGARIGTMNLGALASVPARLHRLAEPAAKMPALP